jgi:hypothetical protein
MALSPRGSLDPDVPKLPSVAEKVPPWAWAFVTCGTGWTPRIAQHCKPFSKPPLTMAVAAGQGVCVGNGVNVGVTVDGTTPEMAGFSFVTNTSAAPLLLKLPLFCDLNAFAVTGKSTAYVRPAT